MKFLILRLLQHSELGMFHAYRRSGREGSRQRAINVDSEVVDRVFPTAADTDRIPLELAYDTDDGSHVLSHSLKRQAKNWRLEGNCPVDERYDFVEPGCLFAMQVDAGVQPATGAWVVFPKADPVALAILADGATSGLAGAGMIALQPDEAPRIHRFLAVARPDMFGDPTPQDTTMTDTTDAEVVFGVPEAPEAENAEAGKPSGRRLEPGAERLATLLGQTGHKLVSAVADIIDNSISANATEIHITFAAPDSGHGRWMAIRDNGDGMSPENLEEAMRVGGEADYDSRSLGKYGFGLKGASWSQARKMTVVTREKGAEVHHLGWDLASMADWIVDDIPLSAWQAKVADPGEKGTVVLWQNMKAPKSAPAIKGVSPYVAEIKDLNQHLGLVFHRFLDGDAKGRSPLKIWINDIPVESNGPASHPLTERHDVKTVKVPHEGGTADVKVEPLVLPSEEEMKAHHGEDWKAAVEKIGYGRRTDTQGLFIYRNDRLICWGGWHTMWATNDEKTKLARVVVDFDPALDEAFDVNISKQSVELPSYVLTRIKPRADTVRKASQAKFRKPRTPPLPPTPAPPAPTPSPGGPTAGPSSPGQPGFPTTGTPPPPTPPVPPPLSVHKVTTKKFAWKVTTGFSGERSLQVSEVSPALADLVEALGSNEAATEALAAFLEELDQVDAQQALVDDAIEQ